MSDALIFGNANQPNYLFSPEADRGFEIDGVAYPTVDQYLKANMFVGEKTEALREKIRTAPRTKKAKLLVEANHAHIRPDWKEVRDDLMRTALRLKFEDKELRSKLLNSGNRKLVFDDCHEAYWSAGRGGKGENRLGALLEELREELKAAR